MSRNPFQDLYGVKCSGVEVNPIPCGSKFMLQVLFEEGSSINVSLDESPQVSDLEAFVGQRLLVAENNEGWYTLRFSEGGWIEIDGQRMGEPIGKCEEAWAAYYRGETFMVPFCVPSSIEDYGVTPEGLAKLDEMILE